MNRLRLILSGLLTLTLLCALPSNAAQTKAPAKKTAPQTPWSFLPLRESPPPKIRNAKWPQTQIDHFLLAKMDKAGVKPAAPADPRALIRRLHFDLTGLPPTPEEVEAFVRECSSIGNRQSAIANTVSRLLSSPHYGERWGRYWLDLARYVDETASWLEKTSGAHLYRDWVIKAFNEDMPYNQFVMRQIATDQMGLPPEDRPALAFLGLAPTYWKELQLPPDLIKGTVADEWEEHVDTLSRTFLGLTLACARCHDHKSDPITAADYYGIAGVFASVRHAELPTMGDQFWQPVKKARESVAALEKERDDLKKKKPAPADLTNQVAVIEQKITALKTTTPHYNMAMATAVEDAALFVIPAANNKGTVLDFKPGQARDLELMKRGDPNNTGDIVPRRFLSAFPAKDGQPRRFTTGSGRLELAQAIVQEAAPLTARVIVNRIWKHHFGRGIVDTPSEFGPSGEAPSHPELLDDLTARFIKHGWSIKWLHREILLSAAWQQSSLAPDSEKRDPENKLFARMSRRRLDFEAWRDTSLAAAGTLDRSFGGVATPLTSDKHLRRTLYGTVNRHELEPMLRIHDFPDPAAHSASRTETATALQMLFSLNGPFLLAQADAFAARLEKEAGATVNTRVTRAHAVLFQRPPTTKELAMATRFLTGRETDKKAWSEYAQALLASNETQFVD
ncbi:MAG: Secreted protein containing [Limisphaerales bacterium]|nr:MAG: Secreted protein containing [Limisphaerales bacterium]KAG0507145.1 MAG: Secreted protein containing [Limisphaerales bacterium]TXT47562.1 MAG: Secreted protein containing [Limisphaerales bacterium]